MNKNLAVSAALLFLTLSGTGAARVEAQSRGGEPASSPLFQAVAEADAAFFDAYNRCDLKKSGAMVVEDLEFYHDKGGLSLGRQDLVDSLQKNICGKVSRELVAGTLEVYPIRGFGAVEMGVHRFHHPGRDDVEPVGEGKFVMLWQNKDGAWIITRVISYDHKEAAR